MFCGFLCDFPDEIQSVLSAVQGKDRLELNLPLQRGDDGFWDVRGIGQDGVEVRPIDVLKQVAGHKADLDVLLIYQIGGVFPADLHGLGRDVGQNERDHVKALRKDFCNRNPDASCAAAEIEDPDLLPVFETFRYVSYRFLDQCLGIGSGNQSVL